MLYTRTCAIATSLIPIVWCSPAGKRHLADSAALRTRTTRSRDPGVRTAGRATKAERTLLRDITAHTCREQ